MMPARMIILAFLRFGDFFNTSLEMFDHQHRQLERYSHRLTGLRQCCDGVRSEVESIAARSASSSSSSSPSSALRGSEEGSACSGAGAWKNERLREQMRFDANRVLAAVADQGRQIADLCGGFRNGSVDHRHSETVRTAKTAPPPPTPTASTAATTTRAPATTPTTSRRPETALHKGKRNSKLGRGVTLPTLPPRDLLRTCEDLLRAGKLRSRVYLVEEEEDEEDVNKKGRSYRRRLCEQQSAGGGWTVGGRRGSESVLVLSSALIMIARTMLVK